MAVYDVGINNLRDTFNTQSDLLCLLSAVMEVSIKFSDQFQSHNSLIWSLITNIGFVL